MGGQIAKYAFYPPDPAVAERILARNPHHQVVFNARRNPVSLIHIPAPRPTVPERRLTMVFSHGNAEDLSNYAFYAELARQIGVDVVAYDYTGYGLSTTRAEYLRRRGEADDTVKGSSLSCTSVEDSAPCRAKPSEADAFACAEAALQYVLGNGVPCTDIIIVGRSLGSGPATHLATTHPDAYGLVLLSPLKSCANVVGAAAAVALYPFDIMTNIRKLKAVRCPVLVLHGSEDEVIHPSHSAAIVAVLRTKAKNPHVRLVEVAGAGHNDVEERMGWHRFYALLRRFAFDPLATTSESVPVS